MSASQELLAAVLDGCKWTDDLLQRAVAEDGGRAFLSIVVERMGDLFEPALCDTYARMFARVIELARPEWSAEFLVARYERIRRVRRCEREPDDVFVLSRITLGADVAVTSVLLDAVKLRFPQAAIRFVGPRKNWELFAGDPRILHQPLQYPRSGSLRERLQASMELRTPNSIVVDPDSRITQLGLIPICAEQDYFFLESRCIGGAGAETLPALAAQWAEEVFGICDARGYIAPLRRHMPCDAAVSLGVGENADKRLGDAFEEALLREIVRRGLSVMLDKGAGGEEATRADRLASVVPGVRLWAGAYAPFASMISQARLYAGYDSAGQHVAAVCGTPLLSIFAGYANQRMFERWKPAGAGPKRVIQVDDGNRTDVMTQVRAALDDLL